MIGASWVKAEITKEDMEKFKEDIKTEMTTMETRLKKYIDFKFQVADTKIEERTKAVQAEINGLRAEINGLRESINAIKWWIATLTGLVFVLIALPQVLNFFRERKETKEMAHLQKQITELREKLGSSSQQERKAQE